MEEGELNSTDNQNVQDVIDRPAADLMDWSSLFTLQKESTRFNKKFGQSKIIYNVLIDQLPAVFDPLSSMLAMPQVLTALCDLCTKDFNPDDYILITMDSDTLEKGAMYLTQRRVADFNVDALMQKITLLNSQTKFCIDESFRLIVDRTVIPVGGSRRKKAHNSVDRKRWSHSLVTVDAPDNLCLAACLVLGQFYHSHDTSDADKQEWKSLTRKGSKKLTRLAKQAVEDACLTIGQEFGVEHLSAFQEVFPTYQIKVVSVQHGMVIIGSEPQKRKHGMKCIYLLLDDGHYDLITNPRGFFKKSYYCEDCDKGYCRKSDHRCEGKCSMCYRFKELCPSTINMPCADCGRIFKNQECFDMHTKVGKNGTTTCETIFKCAKCWKLDNFQNRHEKTHICDETFCQSCKKFVEGGTHKCYIKPLPPKTYPEVPKHIYFDYETYVDEDGSHKPCYVVAQYPDGQEFRFPPDGVPMTGYDVANEFGRWVYSEQHRGHKLIAHNLRGYDGHFLLSYLLSNHLKGIEVIRRGSQILEMRYASLEISARDTLNFGATKLCNFPRAVGLQQEEQKGEFPHKFNKPENWDKLHPFPDIGMYGIGHLKKNDKKKFAEWHGVHSLKGMFDFRSEIAKYCSNDVTVLRKCALKFRENFFEQTSIDPFESITIASACIKYFRTYLLNSDEIAVISANGYQANRKASMEGAQWLEWINQSVGTIEHKRNTGTEKQIGRYFADGYNPLTNTVYEYNGCVHHGHPDCTAEDDRAPFSNKTMKVLYEEWCTKKAYIESRGFHVVEMWSCEWLEERKDPTIRQFLLNMNLRDPLNPRDAFKGGRTNAAVFSHRTEEGEKILHYDIVSLYPYINKTGQYPVGHPEIIVSNFEDVKDYFGFVSCKVLPPGNNYFPVLPSTINGKLMFTLCNACAQANSQEYCAHTDEERCLTDVWCTPELHHAVANGYQVVEMYEVWHWSQTKKGLFAPYVNKFLKEKLEASGWPSGCVSQDQKDQHLHDVKEREDIVLDPQRIEDNPARRQVAKLMLNSFWGKFGQRDNMQQTQFIYSPEKYFRMCRSEAVDIHSVHATTLECLMVTTSKPDEYNEGTDCVNMAIAAFTTSMARLKLLDMMEKLERRILYYDTDSVIFLQSPTDWLPPTGTFLGDWSNELETGETHITQFVSCGPKVYSYETNTGRYELKVKGMTQNGYTEDILGENLQSTGQQLNIDKLNDILNGETLQVTYPEYFKRNFKTQEISTVKLTKRLQKVYDKRMQRGRLTLPFGWKDWIN